jgi:hypothetical protein
MNGRGHGRNQAWSKILSFLMIASMLLSLVPAGPVLAAPAGTGLQFNGTNQYVKFASSVGLGAKAFTVETWFKRTGAGVATYTGSGGVAAVPLVAKGMAESDANALDVNYFLGIDGTTGVLAADFEECNPTTNPADCPAGGTAGLNHPVKGTTVIANNTWYHAAVTYDGQIWSVYLNGQYEAGKDLGATRYPRWDSTQLVSLATALQSSGNPGSSSGYGPGYFQGAMDEVRIWNVARTQAEIQATMNQEVT